MNKQRNRHTGAMNAFKAGVVNHGEPLVIRGTLYFERKLPVWAVDKDGKKQQVGERIQRVRALRHDEQPDTSGEVYESIKDYTGSSAA